MPSIVFPLEIEETILDLLAEDDELHEGHSALKACSLVCQAFLPICRKHIFASIAINDRVTVSQRSPPTIHSHAFERLLRETPEIADYIRKLDFSCEITNFTNPSIQESLKRISRLEFLTVRHHLDWRNNPIRPALLHLLHLPTLTHFNMINMTNFVVSDLSPCVNLKYLDIDHYTTVAAETTFPAALPEHSIQLNEFVAGIESSAVAMKLCTTRRPDGQSIIDFGSLFKITIAFKGYDDGEALQELFKRCHVLTNVHISFWNERLLRRTPSLADMLRPSMQTLKHIVVDIRVHESDDHPLLDISSEFEEMRTNNVIETITVTIIILVHEDASCSQGDDWNRLDEVLTTPGWCSLKRVSLAINIDRLCDITDEPEVGASLRKLPETQFLRLSSSNSVSFDFKFKDVTVWYK